MSKFHIYALTDPQTGVVRYVGQSRDAYRRYRRHCGGNGTTTKVWVRSLSEPPGFVLLESGDDVMVAAKGTERLIRAASFAETKWIKRFRRTIINHKLRDSSASTWDWLVNPGDHAPRDTDSRA